MKNDRSFHRAILWNKAFLAAVPALALLLTGCPADDPLPVGSVDGGGTGSGGQGTGGGGPGGGSGGAGGSGTGGSSGTGGTTQPGNTCGGIAGIKCPAAEACIYPIGQCSVSDATGTCMTGGGGCTANYDPVCGCDGNTYSNECVAATAGVSVRATGMCGKSSDAGTNNDASTVDSHPSGKTCGGIGGLSCAAGEYCQMAVGDCKVADAAGICASKNVGCTADFVPVCGCDGMTYSNSCAATVAGVNIASNGNCP